MNITSLAGFSLHLLGCHCHFNIIDANCLSSRDIIYLVSSSYYFFMLLFYTLSLLSVQILNSIAFLLSVCIHILPKQKFVSTKLFFFLFYCFYDWKHLFINIYQKREIYDLYVVLLLSNIYIKSSVFDTCGIKLYKIMYKDM